MLEGKFTASLLAKLRKHIALSDAVIWKLSDRTTAGIPDFVICVGGRTTWWEVKIAPRELTKLQAYYINRLNLHGSLRIAYVVRVAEDLTVVEIDESGLIERERLVDEIIFRAVQNG